MFLEYDSAIQNYGEDGHSMPSPMYMVPDVGASFSDFGFLADGCFLEHPVGTRAILDAFHIYILRHSS